MADNRVFLPQMAVDTWLEEGRVELDGEVMTLLPAGQEFKLESALRFIAEVAGEPDPHDLVGRVKSLPQVEALEGEHYSDSVIIGDNAYEVVEGFVGEPLLDGPARGPEGDFDPITNLLLGTQA